MIRQKSAGPKLLSVARVGYEPHKRICPGDGAIRRGFPAGERKPGRRPTLILRGAHKPHLGSTDPAALKIERELGSKNER